MKGKQFMKGFFIMTEIRLTGQRPTQETWDLIFEHCRLCERWEAAVGVLDDMFAEEVMVMRVLKLTTLWTTDTKIVHCFSDRREGKSIKIYIIEHDRW